MTRLVVVGHGMVGSRFIEDLLAADRAGRYQVTVLGTEDCGPYNRVLLSEVVAGTHPIGSIALPALAHERVSIINGRSVVHLDREDRAVVDDAGVRHRYDRLVLATGAAARIPDLPGLGTTGPRPHGVHTLRTIDDARAIVAATLNARSAVVLGAGVLGLEAAAALQQRGLDVSVVHPAPALMERQLDTPASEAVVATMSRLGINAHVGVGAKRVLVRDGAVSGIELSDGRIIETDLLLLSTGTVIDTGLAQRSGLSVGRGITVTDRLVTPADPRVFAIGDCAEPPGGATGLVAQGWEQARLLARILTADPTGPPEPVPAPSDIVRLKAAGLDVVTMGLSGSGPDNPPGHRRIRLTDPCIGRHVEVVVADGRLVGATCVGAGPVAADLIATYTRRTPVPQDPAHLLVPVLAGSLAQPSNPTALAGDTLVCRCNGVTKDAVLTGGDTVEEVAAATRATTGCGGCRDDVCRLLAARTTMARSVTQEKPMVHSSATKGP